MITRAGGLLICLAMAVAVAPMARGAEWDTGLQPLSPPLPSASLGVTSRNAIAGPDGTIHLVYQTSLGTDRFQLMYMSRSPGGSWSAPRPISADTVNARNASVVIDHTGRIHVLCELTYGSIEDIAHILRETDGTWSSAPVLVAPSPGLSRSPVASVDSFDKLHVVWVDGRNSSQRIWHATWTSGGGWRPPEMLSQGGSTPQDPTIDADELGGIHIFWSDRAGAALPEQAWDIFYERLDAAATTLSPVKDLVHGGAVSIRPYVEALDDGTVNLVWLDSRATAQINVFEIYYKRYLPGVGWGKDKRFTYDITNHARPVIVAGGGRSLNVVWEDFRFGSPDIFYRQITPETGWDRVATPLTTDESASQSPTLVSEPDGRLLLLWSGAQDGGTFRIFAREGTAVTSP
jgi:hypothetical protein